MVLIRVKNTCIGCKRCINACPGLVLDMNLQTEKVIPVKEKNCLECRACEVICPQQAITVD